MDADPPENGVLIPCRFTASAIDAHDASVKHSGKDDVGDELESSGALVREVEASDRLADDRVRARILERRAGVDTHRDLLAGEQIGVLRRVFHPGTDPDASVLRHELALRNAEVGGREAR